ncbi:MAG: proline racemase family protein [Ktedonobacteraceae bacterium]|nr:proline racemase family protein [Ktedonobacteraceae bacterium]
MQECAIVDSHTGGEPTRVVIASPLEPGFGSLAERLQVFRERYDWFRSAVVNEPRGSEIIVGALLCEPQDPSYSAGVIFFNNVGYLGMCGHGTIGVMTTLAYLGRIKPGRHRIETPVGVVTTELLEDGRVTVHNIASYRHAKQVSVEIEGYGSVTGDIAWGGNWFFLVEDHGQKLHEEHIPQLTEFAWRIREALERSEITGANGALIDHIDLLAPGSHGASSKNFVLCPGKAYDRSPCGTGTSAKLACLAADGKLKPGEVWVQESIIGSRFQATYRIEGDQVYPSITGEAFVTLEGRLILDERDPFKWGIS